MGKRIQSIEFFRFAFACCIAMWHLFTVEKLRHGYLPVEFFFLLSGIWLYDSYLKKADSNYAAFQYTIDKLERIYPEYLISCVVFLAVSLKEFKNIEDWIKIIPELLLVQNIGIYQKGLNYPLWYLSVLIVGGYFAYALLDRFGSKAVNLLFPMASIGIYTYIFSLGNSIENWNTVGPFYLPFIRGIAGLSLGACLRAISSWIEGRKQKGIECLINILSLFSIFGVVFCILSEEYLDRYCLIFFSSILMACLLKRSWLNKIIRGKVWEKLGEYTLEMFMIHASVVEIMKKIPWEPFGAVEKTAYLLVDLAAVFLSAVVLKQLGKVLRKGVVKCMDITTQQRR